MIKNLLNPRFFEAIFHPCLTGWQGIGLVINRSPVRLPDVHCWVSTFMGDRLWAGKSSRYVTSHLGQLSLPSLRGIGKSSTGLSRWG